MESLTSEDPDDIQTNDYQDIKPSIPPAKRKEQHKCPFCSKSFKIAAYLAQHVRIHSGAKPFGPCEQCGKLVFVENFYLKLLRLKPRFNLIKKFKS